MKVTIFSLIFIFYITNFAYCQIPTQHQITNTKGNISIVVTNNGLIANDRVNLKSGFIWPKGSKAQYIYGGGFLLFSPTSKEIDSKKLAEFGYDPLASKSWFTPGITSDGDTAIQSMASIYRVYSSLNYDKTTGNELFGGTGPNWPIWSNDGFIGSNYGKYITDVNDRTNESRNIKIFSDEEIVAIYKDTDRQVNSGITVNPELFPLGVEAETRIYCFADEQKKDMIYVNWVLTNRSASKLEQLNFAPIFDIDITKITNAFAGLNNDRMEVIDDGKIATFSTEISDSEEGEEFGYLSFKWIRLPYVIDREISYGTSESKELSNYGMKQIPAEVDIYSSDLADQFGSLEIDLTSDQKFFMPTEEFDLLPNQSASFVIAIAMTKANDDYPELDGETKAKIIGNMELLDVFFNDNVSSVENLTLDSDIEVFPNPTKGKFSLGLDFKIAKQITFELYNLKGVKISKIEPQSIAENVFHFDIQNLASGVYIINIKHGTEEKAVKVVVE